MAATQLDQSHLVISKVSNPTSPADHLWHSPVSLKKICLAFALLPNFPLGSAPRDFPEY